MHISGAFFTHVCLNSLDLTLGVELGNKGATSTTTYRLLEAVTKNDDSSRDGNPSPHRGNKK